MIVYIQIAMNKVMHLLAVAPRAAPRAASELHK